MPDEAELKAALARLTRSFDIQDAYDICDAIEALPNRADFLEPLFRVIENLALANGGLSVLLDHLSTSLARQPVYATVWMINRIWNGADRHNAERCRALAEDLARNADGDIADEAREILDYQLHEKR